MHEMKQHKPWVDEECLGILDHRKQAKMQWIQDPSQSNADNLNNVRRDDSRHYRNKKKAYLRAKIEAWKLTVRLIISGTCIGALMA
jgi:F0F1-type ATP synthase assembly protein I